MATVTSLTQTKIEELMAGWQGVELSQDEINMLISQLWTDVQGFDVSLQNFEDNVVPPLLAAQAANDIAINNLITNDIPNLEQELANNDLELQNLNTVTLPNLEARVNTNELWIIDLNDVTLPQLYADLAANQALIDDFNNVTLPQLNTDMATLNGKFPIGTVDIQDGAITADLMAADSVLANSIAAGAVVAGKIAADAVTANEIAADAVTANEIAAGAVVAGKIAADAVTANEIAADSVTASELAAGAVVAGKIAADAVTANELAADSVTSTKIAAEAVTSEKVAARSITANQLIISDMTNLVADGDLRDEDSLNWFIVDATNMRRVKPVDEPAYFYNRNQTSDTHIFFRNELEFEIQPGDEFFMSMEVSTPATNTEDLLFNLCIAVYDQNGDSLLWRGIEGDQPTIVPDTGWTQVFGTVKIDSADIGVATGKWNSFVSGITAANNTQEIRVRNIAMRRRATGELIVDGTISGSKIEAGSITANEIQGGTITADLFSSELTISTKIIAADLDDEGVILGGYSEMSPQGMFTVDSEGNPVSSTPTEAGDGAYLKAHLDLLSADVRDHFTMHGTNNALAVGCELQLSSGVSAPSAPPVLTEFWDTVQLDKNTAVPPHTPNSGYNLGTFSLTPSQITSMTWDSVWSCWVVCQQKSSGFRIWRFTAAGAIYNNLGTGRPWVDDYNDRSNASVSFDTVNGVGGMLFKMSGEWFVWAATPSGTGVINKIPNSWILDADARPPALSFDAVNNRWMLVQNNGGGSGTIHIRKFTCNTGANFPNATSVSTLNTESGSGTSKRVIGATFGTQVNGSGNRYAVNVEDYLISYVYDTTGTQKSTDGSYECWYKSEAALGFCHNGTQFASVGSTGKISLYTDWTWTASDRKAWVGASAFDSDPAGDTANPHTGQTAGQHETPVGTFQSISLSRRSKLRITMPETADAGGADDPDKWNVYFKKGGTEAPTNPADLDLVASIGSPTSSTTTSLSSDPTGVSPPGGIRGQAGELNNFPGGIPASLESQNEDGSGPLIKLQGNGAGRVGPYQWNSDGDQVDGDPTYDTGWVSGWASKGGSSPFPNNSNTVISRAQYRRIGKTVYLQALVDVGAAYSPSNVNHSNQIVIDGLPAAVCPPSHHEVAAAYCDDVPVSVQVTTGGAVQWVGSSEVKNFAQGATMRVSASWLLD